MAQKKEATFQKIQKVYISKSMLEYIPTERDLLLLQGCYSFYLFESTPIYGIKTFIPIFDINIFAISILADRFSNLKSKRFCCLNL